MAKICAEFGCFCPPAIIEITIPPDRDSEEYIDEYLDGILNEDLRYNTDWFFV